MRNVWINQINGIIDIIYRQISTNHLSCRILGFMPPADDCYTWRYLEKLPNQIKSRNRCCSEQNTFQRLVSKDIIALFILHVSRPARPQPLPQTTYEACCGGWLWNGLTSLACISLEMKLLIFKVLSLFFCFNLFLRVSFLFLYLLLRLCPAF